MPNALLCLSLLSLMLVACSGPAPINSAAELDYIEVHNSTGWALRVYGNGSGRISHEQLPAHHLHFPRGTFSSENSRWKATGCPDLPATIPCATLAHYSSFLDTTFHCTCVSAKWTEQLMAVAMNGVDHAQEAGNDKRSCRMLRRRWLQPLD